MQTRGPLKWALAVALAVWVVTSLVATVEESRTTWLLLALIALAGRLAEKNRRGWRTASGAKARFFLLRMRHDLSRALIQS